MVATDTVVGIVGAVLLVAVMAGVFAYEYNNPAEDPGSDGGQRDAFGEQYAALEADGDLDGDGTPNYLDDDLDGDGTPNERDREVQVAQAVSGTIPVQVSPNSGGVGSHEVRVGAGAVHVVAFVNYTAVFPAPAPTQPALQVSLRDAGGQVVANGAATTAGNAVTIELEAEDLAPGNYTLAISMQGANPQARQYTGSVTVHYEGPAAEHHVPEKDE